MKDWDYKGIDDALDEVNVNVGAVHYAGQVDNCATKYTALIGSLIYDTIMNRST